MEVHVLCWSVLPLLSFDCGMRYVTVTDNNSLKVFWENSAQKNGSLVKDVKNMHDVKNKQSHDSHRLSEYFVILLHD